MNNRIRTGIKGFDKLVEGGFPRGKIVLLAGTPGSGKTIFALQFVNNGAKIYDESCLFVSFEENKKNLVDQASQFGWDIDKLEKSKKLIMLSIPTTDITANTAKDIVRIARNNNIKRIVIDSISSLSINTPSTYSNITDITDISIKRFIYQFINDIRKIDDAVILLISQANNDNYSMDSVSEFIADGIVLLKYESMGGEFSRSLIVRKMRATKNNEDIHPLEISKKGIVVHDLI